MSLDSFRDLLLEHDLKVAKHFLLADSATKQRVLSFLARVRHCSSAGRTDRQTVKRVVVVAILICMNSDLGGHVHVTSAFPLVCIWA